MLSLIIDTSTKFLYLAIVNDNQVIATKCHEGMKNHAGMSVYLIDCMLKENNYSVDDIKAIYCGVGPGSYTGVRISVTIAKMLASFKGIPLYKVSSLFLASSGYTAKNIAVTFDARRGNVFSLCYGENYLEDKLRNKEDFILQVKDFEDIKFVTEDDFKVDPIKVIKNSVLVTEVDAFVPNYLRIPEAEYNLLHKND